MHKGTVEMKKANESLTRNTGRRGFLRSVGLGTAGAAGGWVLSSGHAASLLNGIPGHLPQDTNALNLWLANVRDEAAATNRSAASGTYHESVHLLAELIQRDSIVRMQVTQMVSQVPREHKTIQDVDELLGALNHIVQNAPKYNIEPNKRHAFPMSALFVYMMYTPAGVAAFQNEAFNAAIRTVLRAWQDFLDSKESRVVLNMGDEGWLSPSACEFNKLDEFVIPDRNAPHWGFKSFNDFFHRQIKSAERPVTRPNDNKVIVSANDGTVYKIARNVKKSDSFWIKSQPYSLADMLDDHPMVDSFVGGDVFQSFLSGSSYHRWRAPVSGTVVDLKNIDGLYFSELRSEGFDPTVGTWSQGYETAVNTRGLAFIKADDEKIGTVCVMPIGITEVSSIMHTVKIGQVVKKGEELGRFSYGGSTLCLVFQPGAIKHFTVDAPRSTDDPDSGPAIHVNAEIAIAH